MDDLEEFKSWHEDLMAWERFQDELERIKIPTAFRQFPTNRTPFLKILSGVRIGY